MAHASGRRGVSVCWEEYVLTERTRITGKKQALRLSLTLIITSDSDRLHDALTQYRPISFWHTETYIHRWCVGPTVSDTHWTVSKLRRLRAPNQGFRSPCCFAILNTAIFHVSVQSILQCPTSPLKKTLIQQGAETGFRKGGGGGGVGELVNY